MKNTAHNLLEVKILLREAIKEGDTLKYNGMSWYDHNGSFLGRSFTGSDMFHLELPNVTLYSESIEIY